MGFTLIENEVFENMKNLCTPFTEEEIAELNVGDMITISGYIYCGRDAVLPKIMREVNEGTLDPSIHLRGNVIFHTAVSQAGVGPTSSNKVELEENMVSMSKNAGVKMYLGKGRLKEETIRSLAELNAVYAIIPPVTALLGSKTSESTCAAYPELGMEALYRIKVDKYPVIIA